MIQRKEKYCMHDNGKKSVLQSNSFKMHNIGKFHQVYYSTIGKIMQDV